MKAHGARTGLRRHLHRMGVPWNRHLLLQAGGKAGKGGTVSGTYHPLAEAQRLAGSGPGWRAEAGR